MQFCNRSRRRESNTVKNFQITSIRSETSVTLHKSTEEPAASSPQPTSSTPMSIDPPPLNITNSHKNRKRSHEGRPVVNSSHLASDDYFDSIFETIEGKIIVNNYKRSHRLQEEDRRALARLVISREFEFTESLKISRERLLTLTQLICKKFPSEIPEIYFIPYSPVTKRSARGKLWECYNNSKRRFNYSARRNATESCEKEIIPFDDNVQFLLENDKPWDKVVKLWEKTFDYRRLELENGDTVSEYFHKYPGLKLSTGYVLLERDFQRLYPGKNDLLLEKWNMIRDKIIAEATTKVKHPIDKILKEFTNDKTMCALMVMPYLLLLSKRATINFLSTNPENIIVHIPKIDPNKKLHDQLANFQTESESGPRVFVTGDADDAYNSYIVIDQTIYPADNPLKAVDLCFKFIHALNLNYPARQHQSWVLLQRVAYGITTEKDTPNTTLSALLADVFV